MFTFNFKFLFLTIILFIIEVLIALYVRDTIIRPYGGDYLVVMLIYCALRTFIKIDPIPAAIAVLLFSFLIEWLQHLHIVDRLGLSQNKIASTVIGTGFSWWDMLAYTLGVITIIILENRFGSPSIYPVKRKQI